MSLLVREPGLFSQVVDGGRPGTRRLGMPVGGAADGFAYALGNALVHNPPGAAALEITLHGPTLEATCDLGCVVQGAPFALSSDRQPLRAGTTFTLHAGEVVRIGGTPSGARAYLCVRGGLQAPLVLGSRSALEPLRAKDTLAGVAGHVEARALPPAFTWNHEPALLHILDGPQADWFPAEALANRPFTVTPASNRMGLRLRGVPLPVPARELTSEPVAPGAVQVTRDGQCIVLGVDGQTIGGYPKVAHVVSADVDKLAQLRPGETVRFARVSLDEAEALYRRKQAELREWLTRLATAQIFPPGEPPGSPRR